MGLGTLMRVAVHRQCALRRHAQVRMASTRKHGLPAVESPSRPAAKRSDAGEQQSPWRFLRAAGSLAAAAAAAAVFRSPRASRSHPAPERAEASRARSRGSCSLARLRRSLRHPRPATTRGCSRRTPRCPRWRPSCAATGIFIPTANWLGYTRIKQYFMFLTFANRAPSNPVPPHSTHHRRHYATRR